MMSSRMFVTQFLIFTVIFFEHTTISNGFGINLIKVPDDDLSQVVCPMAFLRKYFKSGESLSGSVLYMSLTSASTHTQKKILEAIHDLSDMPWSVVIRDLKNSKANIPSTSILHEKPQSYFVIIENLEDDDLDDIFEDWKITVNWNPLAQFVVYLCSVEETDEEMTELMIEILLSFMNKKIFNVNVIAQNEETGYYYGKTVFPYHPDNNCGNRVISVETLDMCDYHVGERSENDDEEGDDGDDDGDDEDGDGDNDEDARSGSIEGEDSTGMGGPNDGDNEDGFGEELENDDVGGDRNNSDNNDDRNNDKNSDDNNGDIEGDQEDFSGRADNGVGIEEKDNNDASIEKNGNTEESVVSYDLNGENDINGENTIISNYGNSSEPKKSCDNGCNDDRGSDEKSLLASDDNETHNYSNNEEDSSPENGRLTGSYETNDNERSEGNHIKLNKIIKKIIDENVLRKKENFSNQKNGRSFDDIPKSDMKKDRIKDISVYGRYSTETKKHLSGLDINQTKNKTKKNNHKFPLSQNDAPTRQHPSRRFFKRKKPVYKITKNRKPKSPKSPKSLQFRASRYKRSVTFKSMNFENESLSSESDADTTNQTSHEPHFYFNEIVRALFLDKFPKDLSGCPLVAAYRPWEPYMFADTSEPGPKDTYLNNSETETSFKSDNDYESGTTLPEDENYDIKTNLFGDYSFEKNIPDEDTNQKPLNGIEYKLLQTISERLHITIDLQVENSNLYHLFQQLIDGEIEMVIGGIDEDPSMSQYVSSTIPYHQDDLTFCVRRARRSHNLFNFLASFSWVVWIVTVMFLVVISLTITWMQQKLKIHLKYLNGFFSVMFRVFGIIFSQSMPLTVIAKPLRLVFFTAFFLALIFTNAYQSFLISTLTTPNSAYQISRVEEIFQNQMIIKGSVENVRHLNKEGEIFRYIREKFQMCYDIEECLLEAAENEQIAVAVSRQHSFYNPRIPRSQLYCFNRNENLYVYLVTMLLPKKFHLLHKINPVIQYVIESGHMQKWARDLDVRRRIREERNHANEDKFRSLTLGQVFGSFVLTGALQGIGLLAFMLEYFVYRLATKRRRTRLKVVKYLHRKFQHHSIKHN